MRVFAAHLLEAIDNVLQNFVERMPYMQMTIRVGRPVMQDKGIASCRLLAQLLPKVNLRPTLQQLRLAFGQASLHRKVRLRQEDRILVIRAHCTGSTFVLILGIPPIGGRAILCMAFVKVKMLPQPVRSELGAPWHRLRRSAP